MNVFSVALISVLAFVVACEGPAGPAGPAGEQGPPGAPAESIIIDVTVTLDDYAEGLITIEDPRITPRSFRALYMKMQIGGVDVFDRWTICHFRRITGARRAGNANSFVGHRGRRYGYRGPRAGFS